LKFSQTFFQACGQNGVAARINKDTGAYLSCGSQLNDKADPKYYLNHPDLRWVTTTTGAAGSVPGVVKTVYGNWYVGRVELPFYNVTVSQIGKVQLTIMYYWDPIKKAEVATTGTIEVLACQPTCANGGSGPCEDYET
jgi:hypothetical protein